MNRFFLIFLLLITYLFSSAGNKITCELEMAEVGKAGNIVVKVWSYSKSPRVSDADVIRNAVYGVCFNGVSANKERRINGVNALVDDGYEAHKDYFDKFFKSQDISRFASLGLNGYVEQGDVIKVKKTYKIGHVVVINLSELRKQLEEDKIIKGLDYGF